MALRSEYELVCVIVGSCVAMNFSTVGYMVHILQYMNESMAHMFAGTETPLEWRIVGSKVFLVCIMSRMLE